MKELDELIQWWKDDYALNYRNRTLLHSSKILDTIKHLEALKRISTEHQIPITFVHPNP